MFGSHQTCPGGSSKIYDTVVNHESDIGLIRGTLLHPCCSQKLLSHYPVHCYFCLCLWKLTLSFVFVFVPFIVFFCLQSMSSYYVTQPYILLSVVCEDVNRKVTFSFGHCLNYGGIYFFQHASLLNFKLFLGCLCLCHRPQFNFCPASLSCQAPRLHPGQVAPIKAHSCVQSTKSSANLSLDFQISEDCKRQEKWQNSGCVIYSTLIGSHLFNMTLVKHQYKVSQI